MTLGKISYLGAGKMAEALAAAAVKSGFPSKKIIVSDVRRARLALMSEKYGVSAAASNPAAVAAASTVFLCVKPQTMAELLGEIAPFVSKKHLIVSVAAGVNLKFLESRLPRARVIRTMPNTPIAAGAGIVAYTLGKKATPRDARFLKTLLSGSAETIRLPEKMMDAVTAVSGSGPAYFFYAVEALAAAARKMGFSAQQADGLARATVNGAARMLVSSKKSPAELRADVTSPGGTTEAAVKILKRAKFAAALEKAAFAARRRASQLSRRAAASH